MRGGWKQARNSAIGCAILLAVIEGVGIGIQRAMAGNTRLDVSGCNFLLGGFCCSVLWEERRYVVQIFVCRGSHQ